MSRENRCQHCGSHLVKCRNPNQRYCSETACQRQRKNLWRRNKISTDGDYRSNQKAANRKWRQTHKGYWQQYRTKHPDYVVCNREKQRLRDQKSKDSYLAKSDALIVKIALITGGSINTVASG